MDHLTEAGLPVQEDRMGEHVIVGPGDGGPGRDDDVGRGEDVAAREVNPAGGNRAGERSGRAAPALRGGESGEEGDPQPGPPSSGGSPTALNPPRPVRGHRLASGAVARTTAALKTRTKATRSRTSLTVWANRKTVQSRW